jgi:hypothetical protein
MVTNRKPDDDVEWAEAHRLIHEAAEMYSKSGYIKSMNPREFYCKIFADNKQVMQYLDFNAKVQDSKSPYINEYVGLKWDDVRDSGPDFRVSRKDGKHRILTMDYRADRINVWIEGPYIIRASSG